jgi:hypothetical protein
MSVTGIFKNTLPLLAVLMASNLSVAHADESNLTASDGTSEVSLIVEGPVMSGSENLMQLMFSRTDGSEPQLSNIDGKAALVTAESEDRSDSFSIDPSLMAGMTMLRASFQNSGKYTLHVEFLDGGKDRNVTLTLDVQ